MDLDAHMHELTAVPGQWQPTSTNSCTSTITDCGMRVFINEPLWAHVYHHDVYVVEHGSCFAHSGGEDDVLHLPFAAI
jgi:hypothetical protein